MTVRTRGAARAAAVALAAVASLALQAPAHAADYALGPGKLSVTGSMFAGTAIRTENRDPRLVPNVNSSLLSIDGKAVTPSAGRNQDDGNLNFDRGDPVSAVVKGYLALGYKWGNYGIEASGQGWYDYATAKADHPWGNLRNDFAADRPLSDSGALRRTKFSGVAVDNLYAYGHHTVDKAALDWKLGYQTIDWGKRFIVLGGLRDINGLDFPASVRPGVQRDLETRISFPAALMRVVLPNSASIEAFYQLAFEPVATNECGTFYSQLDFMAEHCDKAMFGNLSDRTAIATGFYVKRTATRSPSDGGQGGIALKYTVAPWATEFGLYAAQFHSRLGYYSGTKTLRTGAPFIPGDPGNLNPTYFTEYPERIRMFGATFESRLRYGLLFGELTYRPNQPLQYNPVDVIGAAVSLTAPSSLRPQVDAASPGGEVSAWERHKLLQVQLGAGTEIPKVLGAASLSLGGELVYKNVPDLPDPAVTRFGRSEVFGQGPVNGVCPPPAAPLSCSFDGYVSRNAFGYRLRASLRYPDVAQGIDLVPSVFFGHDVSGWSGDGLVLEGRMLANVSLQANFAKRWTAAISWQPTWGGAYNNMRDRSTAQFNVGYQF